jgi:NADH:ubiquinone oxidoreductase subunit
MCSVVFKSYSDRTGSLQGWFDWLHTSIRSRPRARQVIFVGSCLSLKRKLEHEKLRGTDEIKMERVRSFKKQRNKIKIKN